MGTRAALHQLIKMPSSMDTILEVPTLAESTAALSKLTCTIGPSSRNVATLEALLKAGMKVARFDFTWGTAAYHQESVDNLRTAMNHVKIPCAIMYETMGPEIIVLNRPERIELSAGQSVTLSCDKSAKASSALLPISVTTFTGTNIKVGDSVFIGQYLFSGVDTTSAYLTVQQVSDSACVCVCNNSCALAGQQLTVMIPGLKNLGLSLTADDLTNIATWGVQNHIDFLSLSFTRNAQDVIGCRQLLNKLGLGSTLIVAKVEDMDGITNYMEIIEAADAVIFSRGNLGLYMDPEKVFVAQKVLLRACNHAGKPVYVTRVVDSMTEAPRPTRAEATDVANLVIDGADGILLGSETFRGQDPVTTVQTVMAICRQAEKCFDSYGFYRSIIDTFGFYASMNKIEALVSSAVRAAEKMRAKLIIVFTVTGRTARLIAKYKPQAPILTVVCTDPNSARYSEAGSAASGSPPRDTSPLKSPRMSVELADGFQLQWKGNTTARQCLSYRGVIPIMADPAMDRSLAHNSAAILDFALDYARSIGLVTEGDQVVVSQCPRAGISEVMEEAGVVKLVTVDKERSLCTTAAVGSVADLSKLMAANSSHV